MKTKLFRFLALLTVFSMILTPAFARPTVVATASTGPTTDAESNGTTKTTGKIGVSETGLYIVRLTDPALASYMGGISGLEATSPAVTGANFLDTQAPASQAYLGYLQAKHSEFSQAMEKTLGRSVQVDFQYLNVLNGLAVRVEHAEALKLAQLPGVTAVYPDRISELDTDVGPIHIGAPAIWNGDTNNGLATQGEGVIIGVIDSGVNHEHPSFADVGGDGHDHDNPFGSGNYVGYCVDNPSFCNDKLIGAYGLNPVGGSPEDLDGHGSHTTSTSGGNRHEVDLGDGITVTIQGVAPHANIIAYKVCNPGCPGSSSVMAVDYAITNGVDVLNYSISGTDDPWNDPVDIAFLDAYNANIFVSASAGNDGPGARTVAKTGPWNASVANMTHGRAVLNTLDVTAPEPVPAELEGLGVQLGTGITLSSPLEAEIAYASDNLDGCVAFDPLYFDHKIALIQRGTCNFAVKVTNAAAAGASAVIIFNNRPGAPIVMGGVPTTPPSAFMGLQDGLAVMAYIDSEAPVTARINDDTQYIVNDDWADIVVSSSSRGPSQFELLKPDYGAPGTNILAAVAASGGDPLQYGFYSGTSMAAPHGAGSAALLKALHPGWSPAEIKSAIAATAYNVDLYQDTGTAVVPATPYEAGSGRINLTDAAMIGLVQDETYANYVAANPALGGEPNLLNQPSYVNYNCVGNCTWERTFTSVLSVAATYTATYVSTVPTLTVTITPETFTLNPGEEITLLFSADTNGLEAGEPVFGDVWLETNTTLPGAIEVEESFEGSFPPAGWMEYQLGDPAGWITSTARVHSGTYAAFHNDDDVDTGTDDWLVLAPITPTVGTILGFWQNVNWYDYTEYHGLMVSTGSGDPNDGEYVELLDLTPTIADEDVWGQITQSLDAYAGQQIYLAFQYTGDYTDEWYIDDVAVYTAGEPAAAAQHLTTAIVPASAYVPSLVEIETQARSGSELVGGLQVASEVLTLTTSVDGLVAGTMVSELVAQDPTNTSPYNGDGGTLVHLFNVPAGTERLVVQIVESPSQDVDLYVGTGSVPSAATEECVSATGAVLEYCEIANPIPGDYWALAQNYLSSTPGAEDNITMAVGTLTPGDAANLAISGPTGVPAGEPFAISLDWDEPMLQDGEMWYALVTLGTSPSTPDDIGTMAVNLHYTQPVLVSKDAPETAITGEVIPYTIVLDGKGSPILGTIALTDTLPVGVEYAGGITSTYGTAWYHEGDNAVYWSTAAGNLPVRGTNTPSTSNNVAGLDVSSNNPFALNAPQAINAVLWEQLADGTGNGIVSDFYTDTDLGTYSSDDFINPNPWAVTSIYMHGFVNATTLSTADDLNWYIYADDNGQPTGAPGDGNEVWSFTTAPTNPAVSITSNSPTLDVVSATGSPLYLDAGHYWIIFYPSMDVTLGSGYRWNWFRSSQTSGNGEDAMLYDEGNFGGLPWTPIVDLGLSYYDLAFRLDGNINAPSVITVTFNVTVTAETGSIVNVADMVFNGDAFDATAITVIENADLSLTKHGPEMVYTGDTVTYTLSISNAGPDGATGVTVVDTLPAGVTFVSASAGCTEDAGVVTCDLGDLAVDAVAEITIVVTAPEEAGTLTNVAEVSSNLTDVNPANNEDSVDTSVVVSGYMLYLPLIYK